MKKTKGCLTDEASLSGKRGVILVMSASTLAVSQALLKKVGWDLRRVEGSPFQYQSIHSNKFNAMG
jgi:hypothetical protein